MSGLVGVITSGIAVVGTLAGGLVANVVQARTARAVRLETRRDVRRAEALAAVTALVAALADHRRAMWVLEDRRLSGATDQAIDEARATSHETRSAITAPLVTVGILAPVLADTAHRATTATYQMRNAPDRDALQALRVDALATSDQLVNEAITVFSDC